MAYKKGTSGNPAGRPKGATDRRLWMKQLEEKGDQLIKAIINKALCENDLEAQKFCVERLIAKKRSNHVEFKISDPSQPVKVVDELLESASSGEITIQDAKGIADIVDVRTRAVTQERVADKIEEFKAWADSMTVKTVQVDNVNDEEIVDD